MWAVLSQPRSLKAISMHNKRALRVMIVDVPARTTLVSFVAQTCAIPLCMNESAYKNFILLSTKALVTVM